MNITSNAVSESTHKNGDVMTVPNLGLELVYVEPGYFMMGFDSAGASAYEQPVHEVTLRQCYWLGKHPVTQEEDELIMGENPSHFKGARRPVEGVSWKDAILFCKKLTIREQQAGRLAPGCEYRFPTEAQWEFAARGGTDSMNYKYSGSDNIDLVAWYKDNSNDHTQEVGLKIPNELGIYDMSGHVWEWCLDDWHSNYKGAPSDGSRWGDGTGVYRVYRGGSWCHYADYCRVVFRFCYSPGFSSICHGFRVAIAEGHCDICS